MPVILDFSVLEGLKDGALVVDRNQIVSFANTALLKTCGLSRADVIGRPCYEAFHNFRFLCGDQNHENCLHKRVIQTGNSLSFTCQHRSAGGKQKAFQIFTSPLKGADADVDHTLRLVREISEEESLTGPLLGNALQQEAILRKFSPFFHCFLDLDLNLLFATSNLENLIGRPVDQIIGSHCREIFGTPYPESADPGKQEIPSPCPLQEVLTQGLPLTFIKPLFGIDFEITATPIRDDQDKIIGILASGADVSPLRQAESALRETEANYDYLYNHLADAVFILDAKGRILHANRVAEKRLGYTLAEFQKMSPPDFNASDKIEGFREIIRRIWEEGHVFFQTTHTARDGRLIPTEINASAIDFQGQRAILSVARDITERLRAEQALQESEYRFRELFLNLTSGVAVYEAVNGGEDFVFKDLNPTGLRSSHRTLDEVLGRSIRQVFPGVVAMGLFEVLQRVYRSGQPQFHPATFYQDNTLSAWYENYVYKLPSGEVVAVYDDITERKRAEDELRKSQQRYFSLYNNSHAVMLVIDPENGDILDANPAACAFYGYPREEFLRMSILAINQLDPSQVKKKMAQAEAQEETDFQFQHRLNNGELRNVEVFTGPIDTGERVVLFSIVHDVTDRHRAQEEADRRKAEWDKTFDGMADLVTIQDMDMNIVRANRAAGDFFNADPEDLIGRKCFHLFRNSGDPCSDCPLCASIQDFQHHSQMIHHQILDKTFQVSSTPIFDEAGKIQYLVHVAKDITEQKRLEDELFQAHKMEAIGTLAGGIAHDFNNILSVILGFIQLAQMEPVDPDERQDSLDKAMAAAYRARDLVSQILVFSRKGETLMEPVQPHLVIKEALKFLRASIPSTIEIREEIDTGCGTTLCDPTQLHQIMVNLGTNALHAMENQKGVLTVKLSLTEITEDDRFADAVVNPGRYILLSVSDTGCGMSRQTQERIFEPYFTTKEVGKGTGMGLAMVHSIVKRYGGMIRVESSPGVGSTMSVFLPALEPKTPQVNSGEEEAADLYGQERILVVDDEPEIALLLKSGLERFGYGVSIQTDSTAAVAEFTAAPDGFDLIITDQTMPGLTGADLARAVLARRPDLPIIICTGYSSALSEDTAKEIGIREYLMKPVTIRSLAKTIRRICDSGR